MVKSEFSDLRSKFEAGTKPVLILHSMEVRFRRGFRPTSTIRPIGGTTELIMAYAIAKQEDGSRRFLNTAATSRDDNNFSEAIVDNLSSLYCLDQTRLYAIGYLGAMFTWRDCSS